MINAHGSAVLDEMLEPVGRSLGPETARAIIALRAARWFRRLQAGR
jgi:hypothetical protein